MNDISTYDNIYNMENNLQWFTLGVMPNQKFLNYQFSDFHILKAVTAAEDYCMGLD